MKLTGWYRIGIVLSVLWCFFIIGFTIFQYYTGRYDYHSILISYVEDPSHPKPIIDPDPPPWGIDPSHPEPIIDKGEYELIPFDPVVHYPVVNYTMVLLLLIVPVVVGWILVFTTIWSIKWIIRGFKSHS